MIRKSSDAVVQKPGQRLPSLEKPAGKLSALPAMDHTKQQEKLRKILGVEKYLFWRRRKIFDQQR